MILLGSSKAYSQFHTITKNVSIEKKEKLETVQTVENDSIMIDSPAEETEETEVRQKIHTGEYPYANARKRNVRKRARLERRDNRLPPLTIENLIREIKKNELRHPERVLAQAILETGWFTSNVCKTKHNLFGLTNPRTKTYYEFNHWTESVRAYYTKVQYRYKGGDYLDWLREIGYAEAPNYVQEVVRVMKTLRKQAKKKPGRLRAAGQTTT